MKYIPKTAFQKRIEEDSKDPTNEGLIKLMKSAQFVGTFEEVNYSTGLIGPFEAIQSRAAKFKKMQEKLAKHGETLERDEAKWLDEANKVLNEFE